MVFNKKKQLEVLANGFRGSQMGRTVKKVIIAVAVTVLIIFVASVVLIGYAFNQVNKMITAKPDNDLVALEHLVAEKAIILSQEQKERLTPIIKELTKTGLIPENVKSIKDKMWSILEPEQLKAVQTWKEKTTQQAGSLVNDGRSALSEALNKYTGLPVGEIEKSISGLTAWWQLRGSPLQENPAKLLQTIEGQ